MVTFKYPFITQPLRLNDIEYLIVSKHISEKNIANSNIEVSKEKFNKLITLISTLNSAGKLIQVNSKKENYKRSYIEDLLVSKLSEKGIVGAKTIKSALKPSRKI